MVVFRVVMLSLAVFIGVAASCEKEKSAESQVMEDSSELILIEDGAQEEVVEEEVIVEEMSDSSEEMKSDEIKEEDTEDAVEETPEG